MLQCKLNNSNSTTILIIGTITFLYSRKWDTYNTLKEYKLPIDYGYELIPLGYKELNKEWVLSENPKHYGMAEGRALSKINPNKKVRLSKEEFIDKYKEVYNRALLKELHNDNKVK